MRSEADVGMDIEGIRKRCGNVRVYAAALLAEVERLRGYAEAMDALAEERLVEIAALRAGAQEGRREPDCSYVATVTVRDNRAMEYDPAIGCEFSDGDRLADGEHALYLRPSRHLAPHDEVARLRAIIERDRSDVAKVLQAYRQARNAHGWLWDGRGSYEWNDDRYREEFGRALAAVDEAIQDPLERIARDLSDCPKTTAGVVAARALPRV